jgi:hypothetical protein
MTATAMNFDRKGVAPSTPESPALNPGSRSAAITKGIIGQAMYAPTKMVVPNAKRQPICSAVNSGSAVAIATSSKSRQHGQPNMKHAESSTATCWKVPASSVADKC